MNNAAILSASLFDAITDLDNVPRIAALRGIAHRAMSLAIGSIRQDIRNRQALERKADEAQTDIDQRNHDDEDNRDADYAKTAMGFDVSISPLKQASIYHAVYDWARSEIATLAVREWDYPMPIGSMLDYMVDNARAPDPAMLKVLADMLKTTPEAIGMLQEVQDRTDRQRLKLIRPEIEATFNGFGENGYESSIEEVPAVAQHSMAMKAIQTLVRKKENVALSVLRTRRLTELADLPLIDEGIAALSLWVTNFEKSHREELAAAAEAGRYLTTLEEATTVAARR